MSATGAVTKNKDGVPQWTGDAATFNEYEEQCLLYEQSIEYYKRYMVGPRLISELQGPAKRLVVGKRPDWVSYDGGVAVLLSTLRASLGRPQVSELADFLTRYFKQTRRRSQESMPDYITRKCETYLRAQQSLQRVLPHQDVKRSWKGASLAGGAGWSRRTSMDSNLSATASQAAAPVGETTEETSNPSPAEQEEERNSTQDDDQWRWGGWHTGWSWSSWDSYSQGWSWPRNYSYQQPENKHEQLIDILPDFVQGWYLLHDSGLSTTERNMIHTAAQGDYSLQRVAQELRSQWDEHSLRQRDGHGRGQASYMGEDDEGENEEDFHQEGYILDNLNEEGQALMTEAEEEVQHALAVMQQARRTLKEARARQQQVRLSRQYFRSGPPKSGATASGGPPKPGSGTFGRPGAPRDDSKMVCLKCNRMGHRAANCPQKDTSGGQAQVTDEANVEHAPFICYSEQALSATENDAYMTTQEAVTEGWCVLDGGATKTLGSINAVQSVIDQNLKQSGATRLLSVDTQRKPTFSFGNSSENRCASTVELGIQAAEKAGRLTIHTLDTGNGPILLSVASLRALGAIIDFSNDLVCFRSLDPHRLVQARRSQSGHQLLPLSGDMCASSVVANRAIPSLKDFLP